MGITDAIRSYHNKQIEILFLRNLQNSVNSFALSMIEAPWWGCWQQKIETQLYLLCSPHQCNWHCCKPPHTIFQHSTTRIQDEIKINTSLSKDSGHRGGAYAFGGQL